MRILISYGSKHGGTSGIASILAAALGDCGHHVDLVSAEDVRQVVGYGAVIIGGAIHRGRWHRAARRLVERQAAALAQVPVWFFSSGPLHGSADGAGIGPTGEVQSLMDRVGAQGHVTFGGRLAVDARGFAARGMAGKHAGDHRQPQRITAWARQIARALPSARPGPLLPQRPSRLRWALLAALDFFVSAGALSGGAALVARTDGSLLQLPPALLDHSPFSSYLIPGLTLFAVIGLGHLYAGILALRRRPAGAAASLLAACALLGWLGVQVAMIRTVNTLHLIYMVVALVTGAAALALGAARRSAARLRAATAGATTAGVTGRTHRPPEADPAH